MLEGYIWQHGRQGTGLTDEAMGDVLADVFCRWGSLAGHIHHLAVIVEDQAHQISHLLLGAVAIVALYMDSNQRST